MTCSLEDFYVTIWNCSIKFRKVRYFCAKEVRQRFYGEVAQSGLII